MKTSIPSRSFDLSFHSAAPSLLFEMVRQHAPFRWFATVAVVAVLIADASSQVPQLINYQGRVAVAGVNFDGTGQFKFALVNGSGEGCYWGNAPDNSPADGVPDATVSLPVAKGLYSVLLGDATLTNMAVVPSTVFNNADVRLRVWFNDGSHGWQKLTPDQRIAAVGYAMMAGNVPDGSITSSKIASGAVTGAKIANGTVTGTQLASGAVGSTQLAGGAAAANLNAGGQSGVGGGGMVLSADGSNANLLNGGYVKLGRVDLGDVWEQRAGGSSPSPRSSHTAVWTGSEMIVWGGYASGEPLNDGGRFNPAANSWTAVAVTGAPSVRHSHTAVWTGSEMIVWGGGYYEGGYQVLNDGGRYNPISNSWVVTTATGAPDARDSHTAVWTGSEMIVWGGWGENGDYGNNLNDGGRYNPTADSWTAVTTTGAPSVRSYHTAVWTGSEMIVWGGNDAPRSCLNDGGRYNPSTNSWNAMSVTGAPAVRGWHTAVWTGGEMIVWGGFQQEWGPEFTLSDGARYNPVADSWIAVTNSGAPFARHSHTAVWTGNQMIVWGGDSWDELGTYFLPRNDGGRYNPAQNSWSSVTTTDSPVARTSHTAVWTGSEMIVWGGYNLEFYPYFDYGGRYSPTADSWTGVTDPGAPSSRYNCTTVWTGSEMIVWGGYHYSGGTYYFDDGGRYNPAANSWAAVTTAGAPSVRSGHTSVWSGNEMIVWGGYGSSDLLNDGGRYNPTLNIWTTVSMIGAPTARTSHTAVWTGSEMIVWSGYDGSDNFYTNTGGRYNPITNSWTAVTTGGAPTAREGHTAVWTGSEMIVWGGEEFGPNFITFGARYNPTSNTWAAVTTTGQPAVRKGHTAVWTGSEMIVWGGYDVYGWGGNGGARYKPAADSWTPVATHGAPPERTDHTAVWTGSEMIVWGGYNYSDGMNYYSDGGRYNPVTNSWVSVTTGGAPEYLDTAVWTGKEMIGWDGNGGTYSYTPERSLYLYQRP